MNSLNRALIILAGALPASLAVVRAAADGASAPGSSGEMRAEKVLFLGNSITLHAPAPEIGWTGNWGMAASAEAKDYVHLLTAELARTAGAPPRVMVKNIAEFERGSDTFEVESRLRAELDFRADLVIVAIGENVPAPATDPRRGVFAAGFARLLASLKEHGHPAIFVRSSFWAERVRNEIMRQASEEAGATFVDVGALGREDSNAAGSERTIADAGVARHPGDKGMHALAEALFTAIRGRSQSAGIPVAPRRQRTSGIEALPGQATEGPVGRSADEALLIHNENSPVSRAVAADYAQRRGIRNGLSVRCVDAAW